MANQQNKLKESQVLKKHCAVYKGLPDRENEKMERKEKSQK